MDQIMQSESPRVSKIIQTSHKNDFDFDNKRKAKSRSHSHSSDRNSFIKKLKDNKPLHSKKVGIDLSD